MDLSRIGLEDDQTFLLIRLPKETVEEHKKSGVSNVGSVVIHKDGQTIFQDGKSHKLYTLMTNSPIKGEGDRKSGKHILANEESDLFKISLHKEEAVHLGKVKTSTCFAVPMVDDRDVSTVFD